MSGIPLVFCKQGLPLGAESRAAYCCKRGTETISEPTGQSRDRLRGYVSPAPLAMHPQWDGGPVVRWVSNSETTWNEEDETHYPNWFALVTGLSVGTRYRIYVQLMPGGEPWCEFVAMKPYRWLWAPEAMRTVNPYDDDGVLVVSSIPTIMSGGNLKSGLPWPNRTYIEPAWSNSDGSGWIGRPVEPDGSNPSLLGFVQVGANSGGSFSTPDGGGSFEIVVNPFTVSELFG